jgi:hypothetical protein
MDEKRVKIKYKPRERPAGQGLNRRVGPRWHCCLALQLGEKAVSGRLRNGG